MHSTSNTYHHTDHNHLDVHFNGVGVHPARVEAHGEGAQGLVI